MAFFTVQYVSSKFSSFVTLCLSYCSENIGGIQSFFCLIPHSLNPVSELYEICLSRAKDKMNLFDAEQGEPSGPSESELCNQLTFMLQDCTHLKTELLKLWNDSLIKQTLLYRYPISWTILHSVWFVHLFTLVLNTKNIGSMSCFHKKDNFTSLNRVLLSKYHGSSQKGLRTRITVDYKQVERPSMVNHKHLYHPLDKLRNPATDSTESCCLSILLLIFTKL